MQKCERCEAEALGLGCSDQCICGPNLHCSKESCPWWHGAKTRAASDPQHDWELEVLTNIIENPDVSHEALQFFPDYILLITKAMLKARKDP